MIQYNMTMAMRRLLNNRLYSIINILGLALGFAAATLIGLYVFFEINYNRWLPNHENIYKIEFVETEPGHKPLLSAMTPDLLAQALKKDFPSIEHAARLKQSQYTIQRGASQFNETISFVDVSFFDIFRLRILEGDTGGALPNTNSIAISEGMALKYFGAKSAIGQVISLNGNLDQVVSFVFADLPDNTHLKLDFITLIDPNRYGARFLPNSWGSDSVHTYIMGNSVFTPDLLDARGKEFVARNVALNWTELPPEQLIHFNAIPISDIHLYSQMDNHEKPISSIKTVVTFSFVAMLILVLAGINFTNLSIAQAAKQMREVGMRKVLGAKRNQLVGQFLLEAVIIVLIGLVTGLALAELLLPLYNDFLGQELSFGVLEDAPSSIGILCIALLIGIASGIYPAFVLSSFQPSTMLGLGNTSFNEKPWFRNALVILQFSASITLIAVTFIIYLQLDFVRSADLGFEPKGKVSIPIWEGSARDNAKALLSEFKDLPGVNAVSMSTTQVPRVDGPLGVFIAPSRGRDDARSIPVITTDQYFFSLLDMQPLAGRFFDDGRTIDYRHTLETGEDTFARSAILNETAVKSLGFKTNAEAVGKVIVSPGRAGDTQVQIVGVAADIHLESLYKEVEPSIFYLSDEPLFYMLLDIADDRQQQTVAALSRIWSGLVPDVAFKASYVDQAFSDIYQVADRQVTLFLVFAILAILIASLGLYGLSAHMAERRTKEIGIRKVLGARSVDILVLFTWRFTRLVLMAAPIGVFVTVFTMNEWLTSFAYHLSLFGNAWVFILAMSIAIVISWLTVGSHAFKVSRLNPVKALKHQ